MSAVSPGYARAARPASALSASRTSCATISLCRLARAAQRSALAREHGQQIRAALLRRGAAHIGDESRLLPPAERAGAASTSASTRRLRTQRAGRP